MSAEDVVAEKVVSEISGRDLGKQGGRVEQTGKYSWENTGIFEDWFLYSNFRFAMICVEET